MLFFCLYIQPVSGPYDDSFEKMTLEADQWRSKTKMNTRVILLYDYYDPLPPPEMTYDEIIKFVPDPSLYKQNI